jgi:ribosomal protein S18 acetylase RimI-like enzyme
MTKLLNIRDGVPSDASDLAILADMATRGLTSFLWSSAKPDGAAALARCREAIRADADHPLYHKHWRVAEREGLLLGALHGNVIQAIPMKEPQSAVDTVLQPLAELKATAVGSWYTSAIAVFPEAQGQAVGSALLADAENRIGTSGCSQLTLMVGSFNEGARRLYKGTGYSEADRRPFNMFPGSDPLGEWILMSKTMPTTV